MLVAHLAQPLRRSPSLRCLRGGTSQARGCAAVVATPAKKKGVALAQSLQSPDLHELPKHIRHKANRWYNIYRDRQHRIEQRQLGRLKKASRKQRRKLPTRGKESTRCKLQVQTWVWENHVDRDEVFEQVMRIDAEAVAIDIAEMDDQDLQKQLLELFDDEKPEQSGLVGEEIDLLVGELEECLWPCTGSQTVREVISGLAHWPFNVYMYAEDALESDCVLGGPVDAALSGILSSMPSDPMFNRVIRPQYMAWVKNQDHKGINETKLYLAIRSRIPLETAHSWYDWDINL